VAQGPVGSNYIPYQLLQFFRFRETAGLFPGKNERPVQAYFQYTPGAGHQGYFAQFGFESSKQFLRQPGGAQQPAALRTIRYFYSGRRHKEYILVVDRYFTGRNIAGKTFTVLTGIFAETSAKNYSFGNIP
jgi:hypothetical protein